MEEGLGRAAPDANTCGLRVTLYLTLHLEVPSQAGLQNSTGHMGPLLTHHLLGKAS